jgi:DAK2 domain fusion protein YloV
LSSNTLNAEQISRMFIAGAVNLDINKDMINELNVFPVPDGDTGTNMTMTIMSAVDAVRSAGHPGMKELSKAISSGSLRGARGNSGVILSQLCRGFTKVIRNYDEITVDILADATDKAVETAYKAVMKPKEGTILTVAKGISEKVRELADGEGTGFDAEEAEDAGKMTEAGLPIEEVIRLSIEYGNEVLARTPDMLPILKEAGVVDSGGKGLLTVLEGSYQELTGTFDPEKVKKVLAGKSPVSQMAGRESGEKEIKFGYCTEFIINLEKPMPGEEIQEFKKYLNSMGDSIVLVADDDLVKVHVHTNDPGQVISRALTKGPLTNMKIDNMRVEHHEKVIRHSEKLAKEQAAADAAAKMAEASRKEYGFISVCAGSGFDEIFRGLNVDYTISGGQTMNPSTNDFIEAISRVNAKNIFIYPNNGNIIMAANQARDMTTDKHIIVIPTKTIPQGISALISFAGDASPDENEAAMKEAISAVRTSQITYSIRDTSVDNIEIKKGDIMAVGDDGILCVGKEIDAVAVESVEKMAGKDAELISIYYGEGFSAAEAEKLSGEIQIKYPDCDVEVNEGGQPVYYCIISVE